MFRRSHNLIILLLSGEKKTRGNPNVQSFYLSSLDGEDTLPWHPFLFRRQIPTCFGSYQIQLQYLVLACATLNGPDGILVE